jgi:hypothetical protein
MKKISLIVLILIVFGIAKSQILNYTTVNYSTSVCNVFNTNPLKVVNNLTHYPVSGGVSYINFRYNLGVKTGQTPPANKQAHHVFPQATLISERIIAAGINIHDPKYGVW